MKATTVTTIINRWRTCIDEGLIESHSHLLNRVLANDTWKERKREQTEARLIVARSDICHQSPQTVAWLAGLIGDAIVPRTCVTSQRPPVRGAQHVQSETSSLRHFLPAGRASTRHVWTECHAAHTERWPSTAAASLIIRWQASQLASTTMKYIDTFLN